MTNRVILPTVAGLTTLATLATISPVFSSPRWLAGPAVAIGVVVLIGIAFRRSRVAGSYVTLLQLILGLLSILVFYVPSAMLAYVVPTPSALSALLDLIGAGAATARSQPAPIAPNPGTSSLLAMLAVPIAVIVDDCIAHRRPAMIGIPLLSMFAICSAIVRHPISLWLAMLPLVGYLLVLLIDQLSQHRLGVDWRSARSGLAAAAALTVIAVLAGSTVSTAAALPDGGLLSTGGGRERTTSEMVARTTDLAGQLTRDEPIDLFRVRTDDPAPYYLRAVVLDTWGKDGWSFTTPRSSGATIATLPDTTQPAAFAPVTTTITVQNYADLFVPSYYLPRSIGLDGSFGYDLTMQVVFGNEKGVLEGQEYTVASAAPRPTQEELQAATFGNAPPQVISRDLVVPGDVDDSVVALTEQVTAGAQSPWDVAVALDAFFSDPAGGWTYSLTVADPGNQDPLASFLEKRVGFCEQYASSMASMFRLAGVPARVAVGYTNGEQQPDQSYQITTDDAHAWVEAYFSGVGWVSFDPTPIGTRAVPLPYVPSDQIDPADTTPTADPAVPTDELPPQDPAPTAEPEATENTGDGGGPMQIARWVLLAVAGVGVLLGPAAWRASRWRSRTSLAAAGGVEGAHAAWDELRDYSNDLGGGIDDTRTVREQAVRWRSQYQIDEVAIASLREGEERARYADAPQIKPLDGELADVRGAMSRSVSVGRRLRAALLPASLFGRRK